MNRCIFGDIFHSWTTGTSANASRDKRLYSRWNWRASSSNLVFAASDRNVPSSSRMWSVAILAHVGIQAPGLSFRCICHLGNPIKTRFESGFCFAVYIARPLLLVALSSSAGNLVVPDRVRSLWWNMDTKQGGSQLRAEPVGRLPRARTSLCQTLSPSKVIRRRGTTVGMSLLPRLDAAETPHLPCLDGQVLFPGVTHRAIKQYQKVRMQSRRTARSLIRLRSTRRSEQTTNCVKFSRACQMNTNRSSTVTVSRQKFSRWTMRKWLCWQPRGNSYLCKVGLRNTKNYLERICQGD